MAAERKPPIDGVGQSAAVQLSAPGKKLLRVSTNILRFNAKWP